MSLSAFNLLLLLRRPVAYLHAELEHIKVGLSCEFRQEVSMAVRHDQRTYDPAPGSMTTSRNLSIDAALSMDSPLPLSTPRERNVASARMSLLSERQSFLVGRDDQATPGSPLLGVLPVFNYETPGASSLRHAAHVQDSPASAAKTVASPVDGVIERSVQAVNL